MEFLLPTLLSEPTVISILLLTVVCLGGIIYVLMKFFMSRGVTGNELLAEVYKMYLDLRSETKLLNDRLLKLTRELDRLDRSIAHILIILDRWVAEDDLPTKDEISKLMKQIKDMTGKN